MKTYTPTPPVSKNTIENLRSYYHKGNFPKLVAHSHGWNIYAQSKPAQNGFTYCAAIPTTLDRLPHAYGTIDDVAKQIKQGLLHPAIGNLHLATA